MKRPFKYFVICEKTKNIVYETDQLPMLINLQNWVVIDELGTMELKQTKTAYIDNRFEAKMRLFKYLNYTKKGLEFPKYKPFQNNEVGKSIPILNF